MKNIKSFAVILAIWGLGEIIGYIIRPFVSIPGSVIGMIVFVHIAFN